MSRCQPFPEFLLLSIDGNNKFTLNGVIIIWKRNTEHVNQGLRWVEKTRIEEENIILLIKSLYI